MSEHNGEDCCDNCNEINDDFVGKAMFGQHDAVKIVDVELRAYAVVLTYLKDDEYVNFWKDRFANFNETDELMTRYEVDAVGPKEAIDAAMRLDSYRKASIMTGWWNCLPDEIGTDDMGEVLNSVGNSGLFNRFFFSEPTGIQVVLIENENKLIDKAMEATTHVMGHTGDLAEDWLKDMTENSDKDDEQE
tara:strand:+ start:465 stop:1034 length:570 start_codon:yes stop_codon:yes gene_type:complete